MNIPELEGYLVALIAWPVGISAGAWLPPIWGERGWKVPAKIAARSQYEEFVALIFGFLQDLDRQLTPEPSRFEASVLRSTAQHEQPAAVGAWAKGFTTALALGSQGLKGRSAEACAAVVTVASCGSGPEKLAAHPHPVEAVVSAVRVLMAQRISRGPLGSLEPGTEVSGSKVGASHRHKVGSSAAPPGK
jgi:yecA family protein